MARLTYKTPHGSRGIGRGKLSGLPPWVYREVHRGTEREEWIDTLNAPDSGGDGSDLPAMEELLTMGSRRKTGEGAGGE